MTTNNPFKNQSYISVDQLKTPDQVNLVFERADFMKKVVESHKIHEPLKGKAVAVLFYQPSTRTFTSFVAAANRLGAYVVDIHGMETYSSVVKGETLEDTIRSIYQTTGADAIVLRHPDDNSSQVASAISSVPIINAGSGKAEHPTQALLDLYTIYNNLGRTKDLNIVMVGDMLYGRTVKSLAKLLAVMDRGTKITFVSPDELKMPREEIKTLKGKLEVAEADSLMKVIADADVVYMTRVQKEWFEASGKVEEYERLKDQFILTQKLVDQMKESAIVMHPLPRVGEILHEVDADPRAKYFEQMRSGLYTRMALLELVLEHGS